MDDFNRDLPNLLGEAARSVSTTHPDAAGLAGLRRRAHRRTVAVRSAAVAAVMVGLAPVALAGASSGGGTVRTAGGHDDPSASPKPTTTMKPEQDPAAPIVTLPSVSVPPVTVPGGGERPPKDPPPPPPPGREMTVLLTDPEGDATACVPDGPTIQSSASLDSGSDPVAGEVPSVDLRAVAAVHGDGGTIVRFDVADLAFDARKHPAFADRKVTSAVYELQLTLHGRDFQIRAEHVFDGDGPDDDDALTVSVGPIVPGAEKDPSRMGPGWGAGRLDVAGDHVWVYVPDASFEAWDNAPPATVEDLGRPGAVTGLTDANADRGTVQRCDGAGEVR